MAEKNSKKESQALRGKKPNVDPFIITILVLILLAPVFVMPHLLENIFNMPKMILIMFGAFLMIGIYAARFVMGDRIKYPKTTIPLWLFLIVLLNVSSFFYTQNYHYTKIAVLMNICALSIFYFTSISTDAQKSIYILKAISLSGVVVSVMAILQVYHFPLLPQWLKTIKNTTSTIGNSNYLCAFLLFPLLALSGLVFLLKGKRRFIPGFLLFLVFTALLFGKARASWIGFFIGFSFFLIFMKTIHRFFIFQYMKANPIRILVFIAIGLMSITVLGMVIHKPFYPILKSRLKTNTLDQRMQFFRASYELFKEHPLLGTGLWSYRNLVYRAQAAILKKEPNYFNDMRVNKPKRVHNEYLEVLNDGGILAAAVLLIFFLTLMGHGLKVIRDPTIATQERIIASTAYSAVIAIMANAIFFFPFRVETTLFFTVVTFGLVEGIYLNQYTLINETQPRHFPFPFAIVCFIVFILISLFWLRGYKPLKAEQEEFKFKKASFHKHIQQAETHILNAILNDPDCARYHLYAAILYSNKLHDYLKANEFIEEALVNFDGDNVLWGVYYTKGLIRFHMGSLFEARDLFHKALSYNPDYTPAIQQLRKLEKIFAENDKICIQFK